jgi:hypothetical protein
MSNTKNKKPKTDSSVSYEGTVEVKLVRGKRVIKTVKYKNKGKLDLFLFLANSLIGKFDVGGTPKYIGLGYGDGTTDERVSVNPIPYSAVSVQSSSSSLDTHASAVFKFLIPFSSVSINQEINVIRLFSQNSTSWENYIAYFVLSEPIESDGKSNILITWTMKITNLSESQQ